MKYGIFVAVQIIFMSLVARADSYLYWMFDNYDTGYAFNGAQLSAVDSDGQHYLLSNDLMGQTFTASNGSVSFYDMRTSVSSSCAGYSFMLELLNDENVSYTSGPVAWQVSTDALREQASLSFMVHATPEPTSGSLILFGVAALMLWRRRLCGAVLALALICSPRVQAAYDDTMVCFSTKGPDRYADGSAVLDGERYALVWSADGNFGGFKADGTTIDASDEVLAVVPFAKDGRCMLAAYPLSSVQLRRGGVLAVWLLDTRVYAADGAVSLAKGEGPKNMTTVAAAVQVTSSITVAPEKREVFASLVGVKPSPTVVPAGAPRPMIAEFRIDNDAKLVYLTVTNTVPYLTYGVSAGTTPGELKTGAAKHPVTGGGTITLATEKLDGVSQFYSVGRK